MKRVISTNLLLLISAGILLCFWMTAVYLPRLFSSLSQAVFFQLLISVCLSLTGLSLRLSWGIFGPLSVIIFDLLWLKLTDMAVFLWMSGLTNGIIIFVTLLSYPLGILVKRFVEHHEAKELGREMSYLSDNQLFFDEQVLIESGLTASEQAFVKKDLKTRYRKYLYLKSQRLDQMVPNYNQTLQLINAIFRELTETPRLMLTMQSFLYDHLDEYTKLVKSVRSLQDNLIQTEEDQELIKKATQKLTAMQEDFKQDFVQVTQDERVALKNL
ncbi:MAG: 5-bromo-4-chloroindolyl phosphate hydrolysis family protein [Ligilactobacillus agilis]|nr:5-bromo-4-chloroindolyl phosphate hydrolysis family protein [Ligilactobacillus agilis]